MKLKRYQDFLNESKFSWKGFQDLIDQFVKNNKDYSFKIEKSLKEYLFPQKPGNQIQKLIQELPDEQIEDIRSKLTNILDYFLQNEVDLSLSLILLDNKATQWHDSLTIEYKAERSDETQDTTVFITYPTGWYWINLNVSYSKDESQNMGHCGSDSGKILFSLRDQDKQSHITVSYSVDKKAVYQIKGRKNSKPKVKYHQYIIDMLLNTTYEVNLMLTGSYNPESDFNILDLTKKQREDLLKKKPTLEYTDKMLKYYSNNGMYVEIISMFNNGFKSDIKLDDNFMIYCDDNNIDLSTFIDNLKLNDFNIKLLKNQTEDFWYNVIKNIDITLFKSLPEKYKTEKICKAVLTFHPEYIKFIDNPTEEVSLHLVKRYAIRLADIANPSENVCIAAITKNPDVIRFVKNPTEEMCLIAVNGDAKAINYIKNPSNDVCIAAINKDPSRIIDIKNLTEEMCLIAVKQDPYVIRYVPSNLQTEEMGLIAVKHKGNNLAHVKNPTEEMCLIAVKQNPFALMYIKNQTEEMCLIAIKQDPSVLRDIKNPTNLIYIEAVKKDGEMLRYVPQTPEICQAAVDSDPKAIKYVKDKSMINKI
jgi:hypothetical protein